MSYAERKILISRLEKIRSSRVLCYFLPDRETFPPGVPGFSAQLTSEPQLFFVDSLRSVGKTKQLDLFLYTRGGATDAVWPLVSLLREHCERLTVIVPFRAHSAGTLLCLGADEIIMTEFAELSPIDPTTGNQFNPLDPANPQVRFGISVEDVTAYFELAKEHTGITQGGYKLDVLKELTAKVHPLALGNVQRVYMMIRSLARKLLALHMNEKKNKQRIDRIIKALTVEFYSHVHAISRSEAISLLGDWVRKETKQEEPVIWELFNSYADTLEVRSRFNLPEYMGDEQFRNLKVKGGLLESTDNSYTYTADLNIMQRPNLPSNVQVQVPPGQPLPLVPWVGRLYDYGVQRVGWQANEGGV